MGFAVRAGEQGVGDMSEDRRFLPATGQDLETLEQRLDAFNARQTGIDDSRSVGIVLRDGAGDLVGGLKGVTGMGWLYIGVLWLDEAYRGRGLGSELLRRAESEACERGCRAACVTSFSFQAPDFYRRNGYEIFGELDDYPEGETMVFMRKALR